MGSQTTTDDYALLVDWLDAAPGSRPPRGLAQAVNRRAQTALVEDWIAFTLIDEFPVDTTDVVEITEVEAERQQRAAGWRPQFQEFAAWVAAINQRAVFEHLLVQVQKRRRAQLVRGSNQPPTTAEEARNLVDRCRGQLGRLLFFLVVEREHQGRSAGAEKLGDTWGRFVRYVIIRYLAGDAVRFGHKKYGMPLDLKRRPDWDERQSQCQARVFEILRSPGANEQRERFTFRDVAGGIVYFAGAIARAWCEDYGRSVQAVALTPEADPGHSNSPSVGRRRSDFDPEDIPREGSYQFPQSFEECKEREAYSPRDAVRMWTLLCLRGPQQDPDQPGRLGWRAIADLLNPPARDPHAISEMDGLDRASISQAFRAGPLMDDRDDEERLSLLGRVWPELEARRAAQGAEKWTAEDLASYFYYERNLSSRGRFSRPPFTNGLNTTDRSPGRAPARRNAIRFWMLYCLRNAGSLARRPIDVLRLLENLPSPDNAGRRTTAGEANWDEVSEYLAVVDDLIRLCGVVPLCNLPPAVGWQDVTDAVSSLERTQQNLRQAYSRLLRQYADLVRESLDLLDGGEAP